ncbi:MAG: YtxH domain-containing protein [Alistipes sp.]|nr:YtxH domain-containing protein [Alistipes sp.]
MKNTGIVITSLVGGLIVGSALTMLFTPHSGPEMRRHLKNFFDDEMDKMKSELDKLRCKCDENGHCDCNE